MRQKMKTLSPLQWIIGIVGLIGAVMMSDMVAEIVWCLTYTNPHGYDFSKVDYLTAIIKGETGWSGHIGIILLLFSLFVLQKKFHLENSKKDILFLVLGVFGATTLINQLFTMITHLDIAIYILRDVILGSNGFHNHIAIVSLIVSVIYFYNRYGKKETITIEDTQSSEESTTMEGKQLSVGQWFGTLLLLAIPLVNLILLLVWGFGAPNQRKNFSLAVLLYMLIYLVLILIITVIVMAASI